MKHATKFMVVPYENNKIQHFDPIESYLNSLDQEITDLLQNLKEIKNEFDETKHNIKSEIKSEIIDQPKIPKEILNKTNKEEKVEISKVNQGKVKKRAKKLPVKVIHYSDDESVKTRKKKLCNLNLFFMI